VCTLVRAAETPDAADAAAAVDAIVTVLVRHRLAYRALLEAHTSTRSPKRGTDVPDESGRAAEPRRVAVINVLFGTDRESTGLDGPESAFTGNRGSGAVHLGEAAVSIPDDHRMGRLEAPRWWRLQFRWDPSRHVRVVDLDVLGNAAFTERMRERLSGADRAEVLLFVHGFNVGFVDALRRTAQIAYDIGFAGVPVLYSWPSEGATLRYAVDEGNSTWTGPHFHSFLELLRNESGAHTVHLLAHSMGNRILTEELARPAPDLPADGTARLRQIMFAAPDVDAAHFTQLAAAFVGRAERCTLYASSRDRALTASRLVHKYPRAGDSDHGLVVAEGVDTIDATSVATDLLGHSYYGDNRSIISDIFTVVRHGFAPTDRPGLEPRVRADAAYWRFRG
jgi:esterase/lipase superfamily enzyme